MLAHPQEVGGQAPAQPVHDIEEQEAADWVEELTWGKREGWWSPWSTTPPVLAALPSSILFYFPSLTPFPRTGEAGHHGCDGREDR
jgi:hypothetical protein